MILLTLSILVVILAGIDSINRKMKAAVGKSGRKKQLDPRNIPTDAEIQCNFFKIKCPITRRQYALMAAFGVRNHEAMKADQSPLYRGEYYISIPDDTKTGAREAWALYPEWIDLFEMREYLEPFEFPKGADNEEIGRIVTINFESEKVS